MKTLSRFALALFTVASLCSVTGAEESAVPVTGNEVSYTIDGKEFEGFVARPATRDLKPRPGVLLIHDWTGLQDYARKRARQLAGLGYIAFAADIYGKGIRPEDPQACAIQAGVYKDDRALFRARLNAALAQLKAVPGVDPQRIAAIGYCFGGTGVLELARSGAQIAGVVSFHGGLDSPNPEDGKNIRCKVVILHGADDPFVPAADIAAFADELNSAGVDWQMISYSGVVHSFTKPAAGNDTSTGAAYNAGADRRSWVHMKVFFDELFRDAE
ncbi:MAG TPA: dienelactone hydrolase family protein [Verrucomicrobiales bacterium]|nr:dienelactone hydrolase family protein [Verrucomicrobiales bacterium]